MESELLLIAKVKEHQALYNSKSLDYRIRQSRQDAWNQIGKELNIHPDEAKDNWDKLRRCFCNGINRRRDKVMGGNNVPWKYQHEMSFLLPYIDYRMSSKKSSTKTRRNVGSTRKKKITAQDQEDDKLTYQNLVSDLIDYETDPFASARDGNMEHNVNLEGDTEGQREAINELYALKKRINHAIHRKNPIDELHKIKHENSGLRHLDEYATSKDGIPDNMDDVDIFFLSMARMTKRLPDIEQTKIKLTLSNAVMQAEIRLHEPEGSGGLHQPLYPPEPPSTTFQQPEFHNYTKIMNN